MSRTNRAVALLLIAFAGCVSPSTGPDLASIGDAVPQSESGAGIPWPSVGSRVEYATTGGDTNRSFVIEVRDPVTILDATGNSVTALELRFWWRWFTWTSFTSGDVHTRFSEFVDAEGRKTLRASPCPALGNAASLDVHPCVRDTRISGSYVEGGLHAFAGVGGFWGRTLGATEPFTGSALGRNTSVEYNYEATSAACGAYSSVGPGMDLGGMYFYFFSGYGTRFLFCEGESFPREFDEDGLHYVRVAYQAPTATLDYPVELSRSPPLPLGVAEDGAKAFVFPHKTRYDPTGFSIQEAYEALAASAEGKRFVEQNPTPVLREAFMLRWGWLEVAVVGEVERVAERNIEIEGSGGRVLSARLLKECTLIACHVSVIDTTERIREPGKDPRPQAEYTKLEAIANRSFTTPVTSYAVSPFVRMDGDAELISRCCYIYRFFGNATDRYPNIPIMLWLDGGSRTILLFDLYRAQGADVLGLPEDFWDA